MFVKHSQSHRDLLCAFACCVFYSVRVSRSVECIDLAASYEFPWITEQIECLFVAGDAISDPHEAFVLLQREVLFRGC
jgi:hypothetical protein